MDNIDEIKKYWNQRAQESGSKPEATTNDIYLRKLETDYICTFLASFPQPLNVLDIGCGNGYSTIQYKKCVSRHKYVGGDFSAEMIKNANIELSKQNLTGIHFEIMDVLDLSRYGRTYDIIISDRCLINLGTEGNRKKALSEISKCLSEDGEYLMIENFIEGHNAFNTLRKQFDLPEIPVRWHNSFFSKKELQESIKDLFRIKSFYNISSLYYIITRIVYSKLCSNEGKIPDYTHPIYKIACSLPFIGDYGPVCACLLNRRYDNE